MIINKIPFRRRIQQTGNGVSVNIPSEIIQAYNWKVGQEVCVIADTNKRGQKYIAVYIEEPIKQEE